MATQGSNERFALRRRDFGLAALALGAAAVRTPATAAEGRLEELLARAGGDLMALKEDAREEVAYYLGLEGYVYGFPLVMMDATNRVVTAVPKAGEYSAPYNQFLRMPGFVPPDFKTVVRVSVNSVWSGSILDLGKEPVVVSYPESD